MKDKLNPKLVVPALLSLLLIVFALQNTQVVEVRFLFWKIAMSRVLILLVVFAAGAGLGWLVRGPGKN